jgi:hypothetical protein
MAAQAAHMQHRRQLGHVAPILSHRRFRLLAHALLGELPLGFVEFGECAL